MFYTENMSNRNNRHSNRNRSRNKYSDKQNFENYEHREFSERRENREFSSSRKDFTEQNHFYDSKKFEDKKQNKSYMQKIKNLNIHQDSENQDAIKAFKNENQVVCSHCGIVINDMASAINGRKGEGPMHFDCALEELSKTEKLAEGDKIAYIGQGRFGIVNYPNPHDIKHFTIKRIIEWENKESKPEWRNQMAELYSHIK